MTQTGGIAVLSSADAGGGGIAAARLAGALRDTGETRVDFLNIKELGALVPPSVSPSDSLTNHRISNTHFTVEYPGYQRGWFTDMLAGYDLVNVHWASYLASVSELFEVALRGTPLLFMLHDFYYMSGGCHYPASCTQLGQGCLDCPQVDTARCAPSVIAENYQLKRRLFALPNVHLAAPSAFLRDTAVRIGLVPAARAHVLRNAYRPVAPVAARPPSGRILLIADSLEETRKNMRFALEVLAMLYRARPEVTVDVVGTAGPVIQAFLKATEVPHVFHGRISDHDALAAIMARADVLLTASLEDNWPNILVEAGAYGAIPVVGPGHGCAEFVRHYGFGAVAEAYTIPAFVAALSEVLAAPFGAARQTAADAIRAEHRPEKIAADFRAIARQIAVPQTAGV